MQKTFWNKKVFCVTLHREIIWRQSEGKQHEKGDTEFHYTGRTQDVHRERHKGCEDGRHCSRIVGIETHNIRAVQ